jgi:hypothetical protein
MMGLFLIRAAQQVDASEAGGFGEALSALRQQPHGPWLLGAVAAGLLAFAFFTLVQARYLRLGSEA